MKKRRKKAAAVIAPVDLEALRALFEDPGKKKAKGPARVRRAKKPEEAKSGEMMAHDRWMREPLFEWLEEQLGKVRILEEIEIGKSRADAVLVTEDEGEADRLKDEMALQNLRLMEEKDERYPYIIHLQFSICAFRYREHLSLKEMLAQTDDNLQKVRQM